MRTENPGISAESLSLSLSLLSQKSEFPWIVPECVSMSICEDAISNLAILVGIIPIWEDWLTQFSQIRRICEAAITSSQICEAGRIGIGLALPRIGFIGSVLGFTNS
jgi:hypothetical protein